MHRSSATLGRTTLSPGQDPPAVNVDAPSTGRVHRGRARLTATTLSSAAIATAWVWLEQGPFHGVDALGHRRTPHFEKPAAPLRASNSRASWATTAHSPAADARSSARARRSSTPRLVAERSLTLASGVLAPVGPTSTGP